MGVVMEPAAGWVLQPTLSWTKTRRSSQILHPVMLAREPMLRLPSRERLPTAPPAPSPPGPPPLQLPVTCNDIRGVVYLDQQVVACYW